MKKLILLSILIFSFSQLHSFEIPDAKNSALQASPARYARNPYVSEALWKELEPYFLPEDHPAKLALDNIFSKKRLLLSKKALQHAGFDVLKHRQRDIVIAWHPSIKGYLIKAYLDNKKIDEWKWWKNRIDGVRQVQACIDRYNFNSIMKTPKKWIYPLPSEPSPPDFPGVRRKNFILVVEDMYTLTKKENKNAYKHTMTASTLDALYIVLTENLLVDSIFPPNIPFCRDGKIAFLDTEHFNNTERPMKLWKMYNYLSSDMRAHWQKLLPPENPKDSPES